MASTRQLQNITHSFDVEIGDVATTVRKGSKWNNVSIGSEFELRVCPSGHDGKCNSLCRKVGFGIKIGAWRGELAKLPGNLLSILGNKHLRDFDKLIIALKRGYGRIKMDDVVTVMIYLRVA